MTKKIKIAFISIIIILVIFIIILVSFFINQLIYKSQIDNIEKTYQDENVQERLDNSDSMILQIDGKSVLGVIKIKKIGFEGLIYEGTSLDTLRKGVGHFENSPYLDGNVCLAAHNTKKYWEKLNILENGDKIEYISFLGTKEYKVQNIIEISETDWSLLESTNENKLTLITCVKNEKSKRLCVTAIEDI